MTEKVLNKNSPLPPGAANAADADTSYPEVKKGCSKGAIGDHGSATALGNGAYLLSSHGGKSPSGEVSNSLEITRGQGTLASAKSQTYRFGNEYDPNAYDTDPIVTDDVDYMVVQTNDIHAPTAPMVIYQDRSDAAGQVTTFGYSKYGKVNGEQLNGEKLVQTSGKLIAGKFIDGPNSEYLRTEADNSGIEGLTGRQGMSGGGVWINTTISSEYGVSSVVLDDKLIGNLTYGSTISIPKRVQESTSCSTKANAVTTFDSPTKGAGFTPIPSQHYTAMTDYMTQKGKPVFIEQTFKAEREEFRNAEKARIKAVNVEIKAERRAAQAEARAGGSEYEKSDYPLEKYDKKLADDQLRSNIERRVDTADKLAELYAENSLVADIRDDYKSQKSDKETFNEGDSQTFNGGALRERFIANSHINTTSNLGAGRDTVDFSRLKYGITVEIGSKVGTNGVISSELKVTKNYDKDNMSGQGVARDIYSDAEVINGTHADDRFVATDFVDIDYIDGAGGVNSLHADSKAASYTLDTVDGIFPKGHPKAGQSFGGKITSQDGRDVIYYNNLDETTITGFTSASPAPDTHTVAPGVEQKIEMSVPDAAATLIRDIPIVRAELDLKEAEGKITSSESSLAAILDTPMAPVLLQSLQNGGVDNLDMTDQLMDTSLARVSSILKASQEAFEKHNLPTPNLNVTYGVQEVQETSQKGEQDNSLSYEEDYGHYAI